jgi:glycosyltransferase involved in cell wall biosynthesis
LSLEEQFYGMRVPGTIKKSQFRCQVLNEYALITPVRNEESMLPSAAECILRQTMRPVIWVIIDGRSSDNSLQIAENLAASYPWIFVKKQEQFSQSEGHINFSLAVSEAYQYALEIASRKEINYTFVGKLDADQIIPANFFEYLSKKCEEDPKLGAVSCQSYTYEHSFNGTLGIIPPDLKPDKCPEGELPDKRLYRKEALDAIGGFPPTKYSPDSVILAKLYMHGWKIRQFPDINFFNIRKDSGIERNYWKSSLQFGKSRYYVGYHPALLIMSCAYALMNFDIVKPVGLLLGYLESWIRGDEVISDKEVLTYFRYVRIKNIMRKILE